MNGGQDFLEVVVNRTIIVDDQDSAVLESIVHVLTSAKARGSSRVKVATVPGPSLWAVSDPLGAFAVGAALCSPNPCPSLRVVNPCEKTLVRYSGVMPIPLSMIWMHMRFGSVWLRHVRKVTRRLDKALPS